ncbi:uncharacterized protein LOC123521097 [Echinops telfairi]|uniref:Uncharacterized protein LOC123521097 n=1 Tax=Echinops telfairi TaxID=9371 RepID=A0AC55CLL0_ECHTE|nr:uncharacterized protein LOC123521097 [Echinops telfairi]
MFTYLSHTCLYLYTLVTHLSTSIHAYPVPAHACPHLTMNVHICPSLSTLFIPVHPLFICPHPLSSAHVYPQVSTPAYPCPSLSTFFTPVSTSSPLFTLPTSSHTFAHLSTPALLSTASDTCPGLSTHPYLLMSAHSHLCLTRPIPTCPDLSCLPARVHTSMYIHTWRCMCTPVHTGSHLSISIYIIDTCPCLVIPVYACLQCPCIVTAGHTMPLHLCPHLSTFIHICSLCPCLSPPVSTELQLSTPARACFLPLPAQAVYTCLLTHLPGSAPETLLEGGLSTIPQPPLPMESCSPSPLCILRCVPGQPGFLQDTGLHGVHVPIAPASDRPVCRKPASPAAVPSTECGRIPTGPSSQWPCQPVSEPGEKRRMRLVLKEAKGLASGAACTLTVSNCGLMLCSLSSSQKADSVWH